MRLSPGRRTVACSLLVLLILSGCASAQRPARALASDWALELSAVHANGVDGTEVVVNLGLRNLTDAARSTGAAASWWVRLGGPASEQRGEFGGVTHDCVGDGPATFEVPPGGQVTVLSTRIPAEGLVLPLPVEARLSFREHASGRCSGPIELAASGVVTPD